MLRNRCFHLSIPFFLNVLLYLVACYFLLCLSPSLPFYPLHFSLLLLLLLPYSLLNLRLVSRQCRIGVESCAEIVKVS